MHITITIFNSVYILCPYIVIKNISYPSVCVPSSPIRGLIYFMEFIHLINFFIFYIHIENETYIRKKMTHKMNFIFSLKIYTNIKYLVENSFNIIF